jgi:hypothetical protein
MVFHLAWSIFEVSDVLRLPVSNIAEVISMDFDKFYRLVIDYLSDYFAAFVAILQNPACRFRPVLEATQAARTGELSIPCAAPARGVRLDPRLFSFVLLSVFIGSTINALVPGAPARNDFAATAVIILVTWFFYSCLVYALAHLLKGPGTFWETISVSLQIFAVLYVVSSFSAFVWSALARTPQVRSALLSLHLGPLSALIEQPALAYFLIQFLLLAIYLPRSVKHLHRLNRIEQLLIGFLALGFVLIGYILFPSTGFLQYRVF